jgi:hypothetical protein
VVADAACAVLESRGIRCWIAPRDISPGSNYAQAITDAIHASKVFVLVFSAASNSSPQVRREVDRAVSLGQPILPVRVEDVTPSDHMEYYLAGQHWLDALTPPLEEHLNRLADAVLPLLGAEGERASEGSEEGGREARDVERDATTGGAEEGASRTTAAGRGPGGTGAARPPGRRRTLIIVAVVVVLAVVAAVVGYLALARGGDGDDPVIDVTAERIDTDDGWMVAFEGELPEEAHAIEGDGPPSMTDAYATLRAAGAVDCRETVLRVTVRGLSDETVVVRDIKAETERRDAYAGTFVRCMGAGANDATVVVLDLEAETPRAVEGAQGADGRWAPTSDTPFFDRNNVTLARGEVHDFVVVGLAATSLVEWRIVIDLDVGNDHRSVTVDDSGAAFVTSGEPAAGFTTSLDWAWGVEGMPFVPLE